MIAWRLAAWDTPFWVNPNRRGGRYNPPFTGPVQYWSLHPLTPWAEYLRSQGIHTVDRLRQLRVRLWVARFDVAPVAIGFDDAETHGLTAKDLVADDRGPCQAFGERCLRGDGPSAISVPSAALAGTRNLVLFGPRIMSPFGIQPVDQDLDVPAAVAAEDAHALVGLLELVRHLGGDHAEFEAWQAGTPFEGREPLTPLP